MESPRRTLSRLSSDVQAALRVLSCMPAAQGADLKLVARLLSRPVTAVRTSCEKAGVYGIVRLVGSNVTFTHDRHQEAARALIAERDRSKFLAEMARKLEVEGPESIFIMADLLTEAMPIDPQEWSAGEISELSTSSMFFFSSHCRSAGSDPFCLESAGRGAKIDSKRRVRGSASIRQSC